jgi:hypothetical protein
MSNKKQRDTIQERYDKAEAKMALDAYDMWRIHKDRGLLLAENAELQAQLETYRKIDKKRFTHMAELEAQLELLKANRAVRGLGVVSGVTTLEKDDG